MNNVLYSQPICGQCKAVKMMLDSNKIPYDVCQDLDEMKSLKIMHTPTLRTSDGKTLTGKELFEWIRNYNS